MKTPIKLYLVTLMTAAGLAAGCNQSVETASQDFNSLPPTVQKAVRSESPNGEITSISKTTENGMDAYKVQIRNTDNNNNNTMVVNADGRVLSSDMPTTQNGIVSDVKKALTPTGAVGTQFSALPEKVQATIKAHAPESEIANISRSTDNGRTIYEVSFQDTGKNPNIKVADDGTLVQGLQK
ncbi:MAG TPA: PepSY-like domain-containing protein [Verrucomicrobiae bacterium]|nr:PepSY-like domain-containing protein [Verrucomicrobiae bacterium]